jgi:hypothetical protein
MKQFVDKAMRKLDMRLVRASNLDHLIGQIQTLQTELNQKTTACEGIGHENTILRTRVENAEREAVEARIRTESAESASAAARVREEASAAETSDLRRKLAVLTETSEALRARLKEDEATDHITAMIPSYGPSILPHEFAAICDGYAALRTASGREQVSRTLLQTVIFNPSLAEILTGPGTPDSSKSQELHRQMGASLAFAAGRLQDAERGFETLSSDFPSSFNFVCRARTHLANSNQRDAFAVLTDGTDRFPTDTALNLELATFFMRIGDVEAANMALEPVRHAFVGQRFALDHLRDDIDLAVAYVQQSQGTDGAASEKQFADAWWAQWRRFASCNPFQDAAVALGAAFEGALADILDGQTYEATSVVEFGVGCAHTLAMLARRYPRVRFFGIDHTRSSNQFNECVYQADNLVFLTGDAIYHLAHADLGAKPILFHGNASGRCHPGLLASVYERCRILGIGHLLIAEDLDFDCLNLRYHKAGDPSHKVRISCTGHLLHDFTSLFQAAGYLVSENSPVMPVLLRTPPGADRRILHATLRA